MQLYNKIGSLAVVLPAIFALGLTGSPVQAQRSSLDATADLGHQAMRDKILHEAHDRFDVQFLTTDITPLGPRGREVTGRGIFHRHGKEPQRFFYHITVKPREGIAFHAGYDIR
jgi:hypothetical protein